MIAVHRVSNRHRVKLACMPPHRRCPMDYESSCLAHEACLLVGLLNGWYSVVEKVISYLVDVLPHDRAWLMSLNSFSKDARCNHTRVDPLAGGSSTVKSLKTRLLSSDRG